MGLPLPPAGAWGRAVWGATELGARAGPFRPGEDTLLPVADGPSAWTEFEVPTCRGLSCLRWISKCLCGLGKLYTI